MWQAAQNRNQFDDADGLAYLRSEFQRRTGLDALTADIGVDFYLKFMALQRTPFTVFVPSELIDAVWHIHLEDPEGYERFCIDHVGRRISHTPGGTPDQLAAGWENTVNGFVQNYGINLEETRFGNADQNGTPCRSFVAGNCV